ncbi:MAG: BrnA antitoxin family protein [Geminicoccaceae bacterium]
MKVVSFASSAPCAATACVSSRRGEPAVPKDERIVRHSLESLPKGQTDWKRVDQLTDEEIEAAIRDDPDAAPIADEAWFEKAQLVIPAHLKHLWVAIDEDLMAWFRQQGEDWPAKINATLREHVDGRRKGRRSAG